MWVGFGGRQTTLRSAQGTVHRPFVARVVNAGQQMVLHAKCRKFRAEVTLRLDCIEVLDLQIETASEYGVGPEVAQIDRGRVGRRRAVPTPAKRTVPACWSRLYSPLRT